MPEPEHVDRLPTGVADPVLVVEYDPAWPAAYRRESEAIAAALGELLVGIEHMGSTAVPGLGAKPIIDIMAGVPSFQEGHRCVEPMQGLGYEYKGEFGIPGRHYFRKIQRDVRTHQVHMVEAGGEFWQRHLLFRDYLRSHSDEARRYYELKLRFSKEYRHDREGYTDAKTAFIEAAIAKARGSA
ncbi:MAG: GrpB family protein [Dehalococcoidia bacterium]